MYYKTRFFHIHLGCLPVEQITVCVFYYKPNLGWPLSCVCILEGELFSLDFCSAYLLKCTYLLHMTSELALYILYILHLPITLQSSNNVDEHVGRLALGCNKGSFE